MSESAGRLLGETHKLMGYNTFTKLYDSCVCPVMEYAATVWGYDYAQKLNVIQNRAARNFLGVHKFTPTLAL